MVPPTIDSLERELLELGQLERALENAIRELPAQIRIATQKGDFQRADQLAAAYDTARSKLSELRKQIIQFEARFYRLRRTRP